MKPQFFKMGMKRCFLTLVCLTALVAKFPAMAETAADDIFVDDFNSKSRSQKEWSMGKCPKTASVQYVKEGKDGSRCVKITSTAPLPSCTSCVFTFAVIR